jgi:endonuclease/exonuclease/phosphatase family metal-dependent hydrolase
MNENATPKLRVATYNVRACRGIDRRRSEARVAEVISEFSADIVGLQELDLSRPRSGGVDQAGLIAEQLGWHYYFHPAMRTGDEHYGNAVLSRYPLTLRRACDLPGPAPFYCRENRVAISVDVETPLGLVHVINTHFGLGRNERLLQAQLLNAQWIGENPPSTRLILLGDFNSLPGSRPYRALAQHLRDVRKLVQPARSFRTFPTSFPSLAVDHIFISAALHPLSLEVHRSPLGRVASDHYPLVCELVRTETVGR